MEYFNPGPTPFSHMHGTTLMVMFVEGLATYRLGSIMHSAASWAASKLGTGGLLPKLWFAIAIQMIKFECIPVRNSPLTVNWMTLHKRAIMQWGDGVCSLCVLGRKYNHAIYPNSAGKSNCSLTIEYDLIVWIDRANWLCNTVEWPFLASSTTVVSRKC